MLVVLLGVLSLLTSVSGCGFTTHSIVANRAATQFYKSHVDGYDTLIASNLDSVISGAPFPDYLYTCGTDHDAGEASHWPPFHAVAATFLRSQARPWSASISSFAAFMFGAVSHYIADLNWHGLGAVPHGYGFIETLGIANFGCNGDLCSDAHSAADTGGEFVAAFSVDLQNFHPEKWQVQADLLVPLFAQLNHNVTAQTINNCKLEFMAGALAIKYLGEIISYFETDKAPFLVDSYIDHPLGGIDDMAVWTARMWDRFADWIENGPPNPPPPTLKHAHLSPKYVKLIRSLAPIVLKDENFIKIADGVATPSSMSALRESTLDYFSTHADMLEEFDLFITKSNSEASSSSSSSTATSSSSPSFSSSSSSTPLSYYGSSLASGDFDGDGVPDLVVGIPGASVKGSPQHGAVQVQLSTTNETVLLDGEKHAGVFSRFGASVAVLDLNLDGLDDLAVGAPLSGWNWTSEAVEGVDIDFRYFGAVLIFFGGKQFGAQAQPDVQIRSQTQLAQFGHVLSASGDVDGDGHKDLLCGSPFSRGDSLTGIQRGVVHVFRSKNSSSWPSSTTTLDENDADYIIYGANDFSHFGASLLIDSSNSLLFIGAPVSRNSVGTAVGRVFAFSLPLSPQSPLSRVQVSPKFTLFGTVPFGRFGYSLASSLSSSSSSPYIVIGAPDANTTVLGAGQVVIVRNLTQAGVTGDLEWNNQAFDYVLILGQDYAGRFGSSLVFGPSTLFSSSSLFSLSYLSASSVHEVGRVQSWSLQQIETFFGQAFYEDVVTVASSVHPSHTSSEGVAIENPSGKTGRFGTAILVLSAGEQQRTLFVSAPRATGSNAEEMAGVVYSFQL